MSRRAWLLVALLGGMALPLAGLQAVPALRTAHEYDVVRMLSQMDETNQRLVGVNARLSTDLSGVDRLAGQTMLVRDRLVQLEEGLGGQGASLAALHASVRTQAVLSAELRDLTASLGRPLQSLASTAAAQANAVERMRRDSAQVAVDLSDVVETNRRVSDQLREARDLSALLRESMP